MERILKSGNVEVKKFQSSIRNTWDHTWSPQICSQASLEKQTNKRLHRIFMEYSCDDGIH